MTAYLDLAGFKSLTVMPSGDVDAIEAAAPGWILANLTSFSERIDARLRKRYAVPFGAPYPEIVKSWLTRLVTLRAYLRRGVDPADPQFSAIKEDALEAEKELLEAANSETGLFDLPLLATSSTSAIARGAPLGYAESDPYAWTDVQAGLT